MVRDDSLMDPDLDWLEYATRIKSWLRKIPSE
jgi:hypothetical protein